MTENIALGILTIFGLVILGILWKPAPALIIAGLLTIFGGLLGMGSSGLLGPSIGINAMIAGIFLIGFGRVVMLVEHTVSELRGLRRDLKGIPPES